MLSDIYMYMIKDIHSTIALYASRLLWLALLVASIYLPSTSRSYAQNNATLFLEDHGNYGVASHAYVTPDPNNSLTPETLVTRYNKNLRGTKIYSDTIKISDARAPVWIIFKVYNDTSTQDWVLDFGNSLSGRMGMIKKIKVLNYTTNQTFIYPPSEKKSEELDSENSPSNPFVGSALALKIQPKTRTTFVIQIEAQEGFPLTFNPKLIPQHQYMRQLTRGNLGHVIAAIMFIGIGVFFAGAYYIRRNKSSLALASYYMILCAIFFNLSGSIVSHGLITGPVLFIMYMASYLLIIVATRSFCNLNHHERPLENIALITISGIIFIGTLLYLSVMGTSAAGLLLMSALVCVCMMVSLAILLFLNDKSIVNTALFGSGSFLSALALIVLALINADIIDASSNSITSFWYIHMLQGITFIAAFFHAEAHLNKKDKIDDAERVHDEQSIARLQKSKESADQARLIRVIERERELMAELREREVRRTEEMRIAKESADRANKAKSAFLAVVSHEIRTPMNGILGMVQLLQKTTLSKSQDDYVDTINKSGDTMMALLNDILDFEKIESGNMSFEILNFDLHRLVNDVAILMSGHASQKGIAMSADIDVHDVPVVVSGDPTRLRQILLNLVNNAIKFTEDGGVAVSARRLSSENPNVKDKIRLAIKDTGIGIPEEGLGKLFTPFTQAESSTTRKYGGTGLGLAISNRLVEAMDSKINVQSIVGQGSTFSFDLDIIIQDEQGQDKQVPDEHFVSKGQAQKARPMKILVTEDNEMNRKVLDGLLSQQGHTLKMASNGLEALDICRNHNLDLVLMDIQLGGMDGLETTRKLRMEPDPAVANIPVIALTGNVMLEDIQRFFEVGMNGFIAKPIDSNKLNETLYNASIGKFENDPKRSNEQQEPPIINAIEPAPAPKMPPIQAPSMDPFAPSPETQTTIEPEEAVPEQEVTPPKNPPIFGQIPAPAAENTASEESAKAELKEPEKNVNFDTINTGLTFDDREHYVSDSVLKPKAPVETDNPLGKADISNLTFIDDENVQEKPQKALKPRDYDNKVPETSETEESSQDDFENDVTEIQRFLMEQNGETVPKPAKTEPDTPTAHKEPPVAPQAVPPLQPEPAPMAINEPPVAVTPTPIAPVTTPEPDVPQEMSPVLETAKPAESVIPPSPAAETVTPTPEVPTEPDIETKNPSVTEEEKSIPLSPESSIPASEPSIETIEGSVSNSEKSHGIDDLLDMIMLEQLLGTLGKDQFLSLLEGFSNKATEIVETIEVLSNEENLATLGSRAHELKGLAGNFGMKLLSSEAGEIEKSARMSQKEEAIKIAMGLRETNAQTQSTLTNWAEENAS